jgi:RimJ/RimL family protein N-acetyltransferase
VIDVEYTLKNGQVVKVREAQVKDAALILDFFIDVNSESENLSREPHEVTITLEEEIKMLERTTNSNNDCMIIAFDDHKVIATVGFHGSNLIRLSHKVSFGISVLKEYHNLGLGSIMMELLIEKAREYGKTKIELDVRVDNKGAIHLYEKFGFFHEGIRKNGFYVNKQYIDLALMGKLLED